MRSARPHPLPTRAPSRAAVVHPPRVRARSASRAEMRKLCHDLSQPLMAARGSLELALHLPAGDPARASFFQDALAALDRMADLTRALRDAIEK